MTTTRGMPTTELTTMPSAALPGQVVGQPVHLPWILVCRSGERHCGAAWAASDRRRLLELWAVRRHHEAACQGGLILP